MQKERKRSVVVALALALVFAVPLTLLALPASAQSESRTTRLAQIDREIRSLLTRLDRLYEERRQLMHGDRYEDPEYESVRLSEARATVYTHSDRNTKVEVEYDHTHRTMYTSATTREAIVRAIARHFNQSERYVDRILVVTYERHPSERHDRERYESDRYDRSPYDYDDQDSYDRDRYDEDSGDRWWYDGTYRYMSEEEFEREKETWWDDDGY